MELMFPVTLGQALFFISILFCQEDYFLKQGIIKDLDFNLSIIRIELKQKIYLPNNMTVEILDSKKEPLLNTEFMSSNNNVIQLSVISYYGIFAEKGRRVYLKIEKSSVEAYYRNLLKEAEQNFSISQLEKVESLRTIFPLENIPDTIKSRAFQYYKSLAQKNNNKGDLNSALWCARKALDYSDENTVNHDKMLKIYKAIEERKKQFESEQEEIDEFVDKQKYKEALNSLSKLKQNYNDNEEIEDRIEEVNKQIDKLENEISVIETQINKLMSQNRYDEAIFMIKDKIDSSTYIKKELSQRELGIESVTPSPMFGQKMSLFKVEFGPAFNDFINAFPCQRYKPVRAGMSRNLFLIHIKPFVRIQCSGLFRFQNKYHEASSRLKRHGVSLCCRIQNNPPILFWPLERIYNH